MKRVLICVCLGALCLSLIACSANAPESASLTEPASSTAGVVRLPNPVVAYETPDFLSTAGFAVTAYPTAYALSGVNLIGDAVGELLFTVSETTAAQLRVAKETQDNISGVYDTFEQTATESIEGIVVTLQENAAGKALATWANDGYSYSLYLPEGGVEDFRAFVAEYITGIAVGTQAAK